MKLQSLLIFAIGACSITATGCKNKHSGGSDHSDQMIRIDGSSTVYPVSQAVAEEFSREFGARVPLAKSGTGGGFQKFCNGETDINDASRPIKASEAKRCRQAGIEFIELPIAYDGLTVIVNAKNDWATSMTTAELKRLWEPAAANTIDHWNQIRDGWPNKPIRLFGPGVDSGTFDYFTAAIVGQEQASRGDFTNTEDDNVIVTGVARDTYALGFLGYAYFDENRDKLQAVAIESPHTDGPVEPTRASISSGTYQPLTRPLFLYVRKKSLDANPDLQKFIDYYLTEAAPLIKAVGYVALPHKAYALARRRVQQRVTGSMFEGGSKIGVTAEQLLSAEGSSSNDPSTRSADQAASEDGQHAAEHTRKSAGANARQQARDGQSAAANDSGEQQDVDQ